MTSDHDSDSGTDNDSVISQLFKNCASITEHALSLKTLVPFKDIDTAIDEQHQIAKWLDRQLLDYGDNKSTLLSGSSFDNNFVAPRSDVKKLQTDLLEQTWDQHLQHLFISRIRMASSAQAALDSANHLSTLTMKALESRDLLVDQVSNRQYELVQVRERLEAVTRQARIAQDENRALWANHVESHQTSDSTAQQLRAHHDGLKEANLRQQNQLLKFILADLVVCTDHLYTDERIAQTLLKLAE